MVASLRHRELTPGSTGWTAADLRDPLIERQWDANHFEMTRGVIRSMPPAMFDHGYYAQRVMRQLETHFESRRAKCYVSYEVDILVARDTVDKGDAVLLLEEDLKRQRQAWSNWHDRQPDAIGRLLIPPTLVLESVSQGHEARDRVEKRADYERFEVPNYWIVDGLRQSLTCYRLVEGRYVEDCHAVIDGHVAPTAFEGLVIFLKDIFL